MNSNWQKKSKKVSHYCFTFHRQDNFLLISSCPLSMSADQRERFGVRGIVFSGNRTVLSVRGIGVSSLSFAQTTVP